MTEFPMNDPNMIIVVISAMNQCPTGGKEGASRDNSLGCSVASVPLVVMLAAIVSIAQKERRLVDQLIKYLMISFFDLQRPVYMLNNNKSTLLLHIIIIYMYLK